MPCGSTVKPAVPDVGRQFERVDAGGGDRLHPDRLPDTGGRGVPDAAGVDALLADRRVLAALCVGRVVDADDQFLGTAAGFQRCGDVGAELVVAALVFGDLGAVDVDLGPPVDGAEVELEALAPADLPAGRDGEGAPVPHAVLVPFDAGELGLHGVGHEDLLGQLLPDRRLLARLGGGELPRAVQVAPVGPGELGPGVLGEGVAGADVVRPLGAQFVGRTVGATAPEGVDNVAVRAGEAALAVVAQVGGAFGRAGLVADDGFLQADDQGLGVGGVQLGCGQGPLGAADDGFDVVGETGRWRGERLGEVQAQGPAVALDGGGDGAVVGVAVGQPERRLRNGRLGSAGRGPAQMEVGAPEVLEVLDLDVVGLSGGQVDGLGGLFSVPVVDPVVDGEVSVDPQPEAVVPDDRERMGTGLLGDDPAGPADVDVVRLSGGEGQSRLQVVEVEIRVQSGGLQLVEVEGAGGGLRVVLALQAVDFHGVVGGCGGGDRGESREAEYRDEQ